MKTRAVMFLDHWDLLMKIWDKPVRTGMYRFLNENFADVYHVGSKGLLFLTYIDWASVDVGSSFWRRADVASGHQRETVGRSCSELLSSVCRKEYRHAQKSECELIYICVHWWVFQSFGAFGNPKVKAFLGGWRWTQEWRQSSQSCVNSTCWGCQGCPCIHVPRAPYMPVVSGAYLLASTPFTEVIHLGADGMQ